MRFVREHKILSSILAVILILFILMVVSYTMGGQSGPVGSGFQSAVSLINKPISAGTQAVKDGVDGILKFKQLNKENRELKAEVEDLRAQVLDLTLKKNELAQLTALSKAMDYKSIAGRKQLVAADIISLDGSNWFNIFTINRGTEAGIKENCVVVSGEGLVGRVLETGNGWSKVVAVIDESDNVSFSIMRDMNLIGIVNGDGTGKLTGFMLDNSAGVIEGDMLITSKIGMYPEGIKIGKVTSVKYNNDTQLKTIKVKPVVKFNSLQKVAVIL